MPVSYEGTMEKIRALAEESRPDLETALVLYERRCLPLLSPSEIPEGKAEEYRARSVLNRVCLRERYAACRGVFEALEAGGIPYAVIKGAVLSEAAYGDVFARRSGDVDILLRRKDLGAVKELLLERGFQQGYVAPEGVKPYSRESLIFQSAMTHQAPAFIKAVGNPLCPYVNLDVNLDIFWGESGRRADMEYVLSQWEEKKLFGVPFRRLSPAMEFIALCMHHYKDMNSLYLLSQGGFRLDELCDIAFYLQNNPPEMETLLEEGRRLDVLDYVYFCVWYANAVFPLPAVKTYLKALDEAKTFDLTSFYGLNEKERREWRVPLAERLLNPDFPKKFFAGLSVEEQKKVEYNREFM